MAEIRLEDAHLLRRMAASVNEFGDCALRLSRDSRQFLDSLRTRVRSAGRAAEAELRGAQTALLDAQRSGSSPANEAAALRQRVATAEARLTRCRAAATVLDREERSLKNGAWMLESTARQYIPQAIAHLEREVQAVETYRRG